MNDCDSTAAPPALDAAMDAVEAQMAVAERQLSALLKAVKAIRRMAHEGAVSGLPARIQAARAEVGLLDAPLAAAAAVEYDLQVAFAGGAWLEELAAAAREAGVVLVRRDGRVTAYPVALRLEASAQAVRIGRRLERRIRPRFVVAQLKLLQQRPDRFNARRFLDRLLALYEMRARAEDPAWRPQRPGPGPLVPLADLHGQLTLLPAAAADYPLEEFTADLLRLDRQPDATTRAGHRFELGGSTGSKGAKRLTLFDEAGDQHDYFAIRFILDLPHGREEHPEAAAG